MRATVDASSVLKLQPAETDAAVWVPMSHLGEIISPVAARHTSAHETRLSGSVCTLPGGVSTEGSGLESREFSLAELAGIYPNTMGQGVAQGHLFALDQLLASHQRP
jgi:hypothetical protein